MNRPPLYNQSTAGSKTSYQSVPAGPNMGYYNTGPPQPLDSHHLPSRKTAQVVRIVVITLALALALILPLIGWAYYVFIQKRTVIDRANLLVYTTAGPTQFLLVATVSTTIVKILLGPLIGLYAFSATGDWLISSEHGLHQRLPTPVHLGTLLTIFQSVSALSLFHAMKGATNRKQLAWPPVLKKAVALLVWFLFLSYSLTSLSLWLQANADATDEVPATTNFQSIGYNTQNTLFARTVNSTLCGEENARQLNSIYRAPACGLTDFTQVTPAYTASRATQVMTNNSDVSRAVWLNDNTAILAPATAPSIGYRAKALGVRATCQSVMEQCVQCNGTRSNVVIQCAGDNTGPRLVCTAAAKVNVTTDSRGAYSPSGPISRTNGTKIFRDFNANPFAYGDVVTSFAYMNQSLLAGGLDYFAGNTGYLVHGRSGGTNVMYCDISVFDVTYQFTPPETYTMTSSALTDIMTAGYVAFGMGTWFTVAGRGFESIDGAGQRGGATYPEIYARQLSKIAISTVTPIVPATASDSLLAGRASGTRVTLIGMLLLFILIGCTLVTIICIGVHATIVNLKSKSRFMAAARGRLISVYPLIGDSFGGLNFDFQNHSTAVSAGMDETAFIQETEGDRLHLVQEDVDGGPMQGRTIRLRPRRV